MERPGLLQPCAQSAPLRQAVVAEHGGHFPRRPQRWPRCRALAAPRRQRLQRFALGSAQPFWMPTSTACSHVCWPLRTTLAQAAMKKPCGRWPKQLLPDRVHTMPRYTQGLMGCGATVCCRASPLASQCPLQPVAKRRSQATRPSATRSRHATQTQSQAWWLLCAARQQPALGLQRRPRTRRCHAMSGRACSAHSVYASAQALEDGLGQSASWQALCCHASARIWPALAACADAPRFVLAPGGGGLAGGRATRWVRLCQGRGAGLRAGLPPLGLPAPVRKLMLEAF